MPYNDGFVLALMHKGRPAWEKKGKVFLPFNSEYSLRVKNKTDKKAIAKISIDGKSIDSDDDGFVVNPKSDLDIERFLEGSLDKGSKFKFVPLSDGEVQDPTSSENGIIEVKIYRAKEEEKPTVWWTCPCGYGTHVDTPQIHFPDVTWDASVASFSTPRPTHNCFHVSTGLANSVSTSDCNVVDNSSVSGAACDLDFTLAGCMSDTSENLDTSGATVHGGESSQSFIKVDDFEIEDEPIILKLKIVGREFDEARDTFCTKCGRKRGCCDKFCGSCGTRYNR